MRRVVTGDDIAQVRNPDPFAVPAWRSPVYRTPLWIVAIVHFVRMIVWLVRFLFRHPVLVLAVIVGVLMWRVTGWLGLVVLAVSIAAVLAVWRWRFPVSFSRFIGAPARGQWRAWHYRRRWAAVMTIGRLAPVYQGRVLLPVLGKVSATALHRPGAGPAGVGPVRGRLRRPGRQPGPRVRRHAVPDPLRLPGCAGAGVRPPRRPGRHHPRPGHPRSRWTCGRCRSAAARTAWSGWSGCTAPTC